MPAGLLFHSAASATRVPPCSLRRTAVRLRLTALLLPLTHTLDMTLEELVGEERKSAKSGKRGPAPKIQQQLERINALPKAQQRFVMQMIETVLQQQGA
jgi:hypothetical protein